MSKNYTGWADSWLVVAFIVGVVALVAGWQALIAVITESVTQIFGGIGR